MPESGICQPPSKSINPELVLDPPDELDEDEDDIVPLDELPVDDALLLLLEAPPVPLDELPEDEVLPLMDPPVPLAPDPPVPLVTPAGVLPAEQAAKMEPVSVQASRMGPYFT